MKKLSLLPLLLLAGLCLNAQVKEKKIKKYASTIKAKELKQKLSVIASREMEGRGTATEGQRKAAAYIEAQFRKIGLEPGNGNSYQQAFNVYRDSLGVARFNVNGQALNIEEDYTLSNLSQVNNGEFRFDNIVFVGYGISDSAYDDLKGIDVKGKVVLIMEGEPKRPDGKYLITGTDRMSPKWFFSNARVSNLMKKGASTVLFFQRNVARMRDRSALYFKPKENSPINFVTIYPSGLNKLVGTDTAGQIIKMITGGEVASAFSINRKVELAVSKKVVSLSSTNVLGLLRGTDKPDEYVFLTAHYDHLGMRDSIIYYGADDDGSGTTAIIEIAEAFAKAKKKGHGPRRSIVFMAVSGEEYGLWGSEFYSDNPVFPLDKTTIDLNIDMIGRIDPKYKGDSLNYVYVIGDDKLSSDLRPITDSVNNRYVNMQLDRRFNDVTDPNRFYYRSDHYNFAKKGVPIIFYFNGTHADYHRPTDTIDKINFDLMEKRTRLVFYTAWEAAHRNQMLKRDIPLNIPPR